MRYFHTLNFTCLLAGHPNFWSQICTFWIHQKNPTLYYYSMNSFYFFTVTDVEQDFKEARERGLPQPILYVAEYLSVDSEGLRWHRAFRNAGHFAYILLWSVVYVFTFLPFLSARKYVQWSFESYVICTYFVHVYYISKN